VIMTETVDTQSAPAYTRGSVVAYLKAAEGERQRLQGAIAEAQARSASVRGRIERLDSLGLGTATPAGGVDRTPVPPRSDGIPLTAEPTNWWSIDIGTTVEP
jgi:hypothetical protein